MWYKAYQWEDNPFSIKPNTNLIGLEKEKEQVTHFLTSGSVCLLTGNTGTGKTSLLKLLRSELKKERVVYINAEELDEFFDLNKHLRSQRSLLDKVLFRPPRNVLLLLDEGHASDSKLKDHIKTLYDHGVLKGVVMAQTKPPFDYSEGFRHRIGNRIVRMSKLSDQQARELIELRTGGKHPFHTDAMDALARHADYNPRKLLELCELVSMHLADKVKGGELKLIGAEQATEVVQRVKDNFFEEEPYRLAEPELDSGVLDLGAVDSMAFSPMQNRVLKILAEGHRSAGQLAQILNTSEGSVGKQLSLLMERRVVKVVNHRRPKIYGLAEDFKDDLASLGPDEPSD